MNRKIFEQIIGFESISSYPKLPCPYCNQNNLVLDKQTINYKMVSLVDAPIDSSSIKVEYFSPPIPLFNISNNIPENIREEILQAFNHFHSDITSSGTKALLEDAACTAQMDNHHWKLGEEKPCAFTLTIQICQ